MFRDFRFNSFGCLVFEFVGFVFVSSKFRVFRYPIFVLRFQA